ncbi:MAG: 4Fe-4S binding protein [Rhodospirillaceae bacterium]|nr:4Fe-4S binding protein [Rhodospirillaceae bacterium]MBL6930331.1 4Fe-4S binding protein [Rhodospirillales bacterium]
MVRSFFPFIFSIFLILCPFEAKAGLDEEELADLIIPPYKLGTRDEGLPLWTLLDGGGAPAGYVFESNDLAPIPGFSGTPINLLISIDQEGKFLEVKVLSQNEPVFVSGLGARPLHKFVRQYQGESLASNIKVSSKYGTSGPGVDGTIVLDGVTKATASVRIVNETTLASALKVAREKLAGVAPKPAGRPRKDIFELMSWNELIDSGLVQHLRLANKDVELAFKGSMYEGEDEEALADPEGLYIDLWFADLGLPIIARNILSEAGITELYTHVEEHEEPLLVLANGRHSVVHPDFVRNTAPERLGIIQDGFPVSIRDADVDIFLKPEIPESEQAMAFRLDRRLGFDPASPWSFYIKTIRKRGQFRPEVASRNMTAEYSLPETYFILPEEKSDTPPWVASWKDQTWNLIALGLFLAALSWALLKQKKLTNSGYLNAFRYSALAFTLFGIGWYGQGQLSIVNLLALVRATTEQQGLTFLLYDPITLSIWIFVLVSLIAWGRGVFCGWLCPFGVLQEISHLLGRLFRLPALGLSARYDNLLLKMKYPILGGLVLMAVISPSLTDKLVEVEPFKTSITLYFDRSLPHVVYAAVWLLMGMFLFKPFCRFICPLGAGLALLGQLRVIKSIPRYNDCGSPCHLCQVRCQYNAIDNTGKIDYDECFQCLECVDIYYDDKKCVPLILAARAEKK